MANTNSSAPTGSWMYARMRAAKDNPRPRTRPPLPKIRLREVCPRTMAAIPNGRIREKILSIKLATAILLSTGWLRTGLLGFGLINDGLIVAACVACGGAGDVGIASGTSGLAQRWQYFRPSGFSCAQ